MAGVSFAAVTPEIATGTSLITLLQIVAAANQRVKVRELSVSFTGVTNTSLPILVKIVRQTTAGTMSALTPKKWNESDGETLQTTAQSSATSEPTTTDVIMAEEVHPQGGYTWQAPFGGEITVKGGNRLGISVTAAASVNAVARVVGEE